MLIALLALLIAAPAAAQFAPDFDKAAAEAAFNEAAKAHTRQVRDLYGQRGLPPPRTEVASLEQVRGFLARRKTGMRGRRPVAMSDGAGERDPYPANTAVLFYQDDGALLNAWLFDAAGLRAAARRDSSNGRLDYLATLMRQSLGVDGLALTRTPRLRGEKPPAIVKRKQLEKDAEALAALTLPPEIRTGLHGVEHLVIVGNGVVATIPHAMLPAGGGKSLIDRVTISLSAGLFDLDQMVEPWDGRRMTARALVVGDPVVKPSAEWEVPPLPGAAAEARAVAAAYAVEPVIGAAARKDALTPRLAAASVLYFAAHGVSNPREPLTGGFLMLAGDDAEGGFLRARELQAVQLSAHLAVLSACQSGLGKVHDGGVIGLSRSFQKAGVARVAMSLWSVSDEATGYMMTRFAKATLDHAPAVALRMAMLETRKRYPDPALWAPFVIFGTPR